MAINTKVYQDAYSRFRGDLQQAISFTHPDYTHSGITRERARRVEAARKRLRQSIPSPLNPETITDKRPAVLDGLAPKTADAVAVHGLEWSKVEAMLKAGHPIQAAILGTESVERLAAILSHAEVWAYGQDTRDPEGVAADLRSMVYDRLVQVGYEPAVRANTSNEQFEAHEAWRTVMTEALTLEPTLGAVTSLHAADPEGYQTFVMANAIHDAGQDTSRAVQRLDRLVVVDGLPKED